MGLDDARAEEAGLGEAPPPPDPQPSSSVFPSLDHSMSGVDEARMAEAGVPVPAPGDDEEGAVYDDELDFESAPDEIEGDLVPAGRVDPAVAEEAAEHRAGAPPRGRNRVLIFLGHVWDELRRVQWPDRRQVGQATAVVLGFIVIAGGYLGLLDALWKPLIDAIL